MNLDTATMILATVLVALVWAIWRNQLRERRTLLRLIVLTTAYPALLWGFWKQGSQTLLMFGLIAYLVAVWGGMRAYRRMRKRAA
jgi:hypothetical protein